MSDKVKISAAGNVEIPAYLVLKMKGFSVRWERGGENSETWYAEKENLCFSGEGPIELLGVVDVYETRGNNWKASDEEIDEFLERYER